MKIEIEVTESENRSMSYTVRADDRSSGELTFDEMLGLVASMTMPERRRCLEWMNTKEEWEARRQWITPT